MKSERYYHLHTRKNKCNEILYQYCKLFTCFDSAKCWRTATVIQIGWNRPKSFSSSSCFTLFVSSFLHHWILFVWRKCVFVCNLFCVPFWFYYVFVTDCCCCCCCFLVLVVSVFSCQTNIHFFSLKKSQMMLKHTVHRDSHIHKYKKKNPHVN